MQKFSQEQQESSSRNSSAVNLHPPSNKFKDFQEHQTLNSNKNPQRQHLSSFRCLYCNSFARDPILTHCGHIFCWRCIYTQSKSKKSFLVGEKEVICLHCKDRCLIEDCYPVYVDAGGKQNQQKKSINAERTPEKQFLKEGEQKRTVSEGKQLTNWKAESQLSDSIEVPNRPAAKHPNKIMNPNMIGAGLPLASNDLLSNTNLRKMVAGYSFSPSTAMQSLNSIEEGNPQDQDVRESHTFKIIMHFMVGLILISILWAVL